MAGPEGTQGISLAATGLRSSALSRPRPMGPVGSGATLSLDCSVDEVERPKGVLTWPLGTSSSQQARDIKEVSVSGLSWQHHLLSVVDSAPWLKTLSSVPRLSCPRIKSLGSEVPTHQSPNHQSPLEAGLECYLYRGLGRSEAGAGWGGVGRGICSPQSLTLGFPLLQVTSAVSKQLSFRLTPAEQRPGDFAKLKKTTGGAQKNYAFCRA